MFHNGNASEAPTLPKGKFKCAIQMFYQNDRWSKMMVSSLMEKLKKKNRIFFSANLGQTGAYVIIEASHGFPLIT